MILLYFALFSFHKFDCIVALKRSGWMMGAYLSNMRGIPVFSSSEVNNIPEKFRDILVVDDKIWSGRSLLKITHRLYRQGKRTKAVCLYVEGTVFPDFYVELVGEKVKLFYER